MRLSSGILNILSVLLITTALSLTACSKMLGSDPIEDPTVYPDDDAPVTAIIQRRELILSNNSMDTIYFRLFPSEILPVIEWAPCLAPEVCPADEIIDPVAKTRIPLGDLVESTTESVTVYWWHFLAKQPGASIPPMEIEEFVVPLP